MTAERVIVRQAEDVDAADWDAYIEASPISTFFHLYGWRRVIEAAYGYKGIYLMATRDERLVGVLPLIDVVSPLFGRNLISTAFTVGGGVIAADAEAAALLAETAFEEGRRRRVGYIELRSQTAALENWRVKNDVYAGFETTMPATEEEALLAIPRRRRAEVRKSLDAVATGELSYEFGADAESFYALYARAMRDHGTPIFSRLFLARLLDEFAAKTDILVVRAESEPILALLSFHFRGRVMPYYIGGKKNARARRATDLAIWAQMRHGAAQGANIFDFGRSKYGSGSYAFKSHWGAEPRPLEYQYGLVRADRTPNVNPDNPKYSRAIAVWRKLPLPVANVAGPILARHIA